MSSVSIKKISITALHTDAIVNAANDGLWAGSGVCGAIFAAAGHALLKKACDAIEEIVKSGVDKAMNDYNG